MEKKQLEFTPLYCKDSLNIVNTYGTAGVITLWTKIAYAVDRFIDAGIDLNPKTSQIAAFGSLYGNGLKHLLSNLLYNPQIAYLIICGSNRSGSSQELQNFFNFGVEKSNELGAECNRIIGANKTIPINITLDMFKVKPKIFVIENLNAKDIKETLTSILSEISAHRLANTAERVRVELPEPKIKFYPSNPSSHTIIKETPLEAWKELVFCINRFGVPQDLGKKGKRIELLNMKVIVNKPTEDDYKTLEQYGISCDYLKQYQEDILNGEHKPQLDYTYGNRLRAYFDVDSLEECVKRLNDNPSTRHAYISLWDPRCDLSKDKESAPCLCSICFRRFNGKLNLTASFRVHNALDGWLRNIYGLIKIMDFVSAKTNIEKGALCVISQS
ncbi:Thymidylate synthase, partial [Candidatus Magnetoovum chiemensis]